MGSRFLTVVILGAGIVVLGMQPAVFAQAQPTQTPPAPTPTTDVDKLPISLDRIREQLSHDPVFSENLLRALDIPVFRVETHSDIVFRPDPNYWKDTDVGSYVRPHTNKWDYDLQKMMNPNLPTGYGPGGGGVDVLPAIQSLFTGIRNGFRNQSAEATRKQIQEELRQINEQRRAAGLPPLEETPTTTSTTRQPDQP
jgi:hypothetical protein